MSKSRHMQSRMSHRGINDELVNLTMQFGVEVGDKTVLSEKQLKSLIAELDQIRMKAVKAIDKGGIVVVACPVKGTLITTYGLDSFRKH